MYMKRLGKNDQNYLKTCLESMPTFSLLNVDLEQKKTNEVSGHLS